MGKEDAFTFKCRKLVKVGDCIAYIFCCHSSKEHHTSVIRQFLTQNCQIASEDLEYSRKIFV